MAARMAIASKTAMSLAKQVGRPVLMRGENR